MPISKDREDFRFYKIWADMKTRCLNKKCARYYAYGGSGITICQEWISYQNFYNDMWEDYLAHVDIHGERQTTIDRVNEKLGYSPENCAWATYSVQNSHKVNNTYFKAISPDGTEYISRDKTNFSKAYNLKRQGILKCINGNYKQHKGWRFEVYNG